MKRLLVAWLAAATLSAPAVGEDAETKGWEESDGVPAWVLDPPAREGLVSVVDAGQSNLLHLAYPFGHSETLRTVARCTIGDEVARRLRGALGLDADRVAEAVPAEVTWTRRAFHLTPPERGQEMAVRTEIEKRLR